MRTTLRIELARLDSFIKWSLDRVLPRNLTARYLLGLGVVATLSIVGQLIIQLSLTRQIALQDQIRFLDTRIPVAETLRKNVLVLQLSSNMKEMEKQAAAIKTLAGELPAGNQVVRGAEELYAALVGRRMGGAAAARARATSLADRLIEAALQAEKSLKTTVTDLEQQHRDQVKRFKKTELLLTFSTLCILLLEALYIFRPAVSRLYDALRVRSDFLSRMSHEIRNPMNSIIGMTNLLGETPINDQQKRYVSILRNSSRGLLDMLNSLLDFSSLESGKLKLESIPFDLYEVLGRAIDMAVVGAHANGIEVVLDLDSEVPLRLIGDPSRLFQVLANLLGNAVKFTRRGQVLLRVQTAQDPKTPAITFTVIDTGIGIDAQKLDSIFDPFVQEDSSVKRRFGGTGLGLSIARQLVERMGGRLLAKSIKDKGSEFSFTIVFSSNERRSIASFIADHPIAAHQVTVFEGDPQIADVICRLVGICGGSCALLDDKSKILETVLKTEVGHVVILDYESVKTEMASLLPVLAKRDLDTVHLIILLKTTASAGDLETLGRVGVKNLLFKPVKPLQFIEALSDALGATETRAQPAPLNESERPVRPLSILVSDDSHDNQMLIGLYLQSTPHRIVYADDGRVALQKFKESRFDLVFMDLQMPEMDGYSATQAIRKWERALRLRPVPIIAISAHDSSHDAERFKASGFTTHLVKPIDALTLRRAVLGYATRSNGPDVDEASPPPHDPNPNKNNDDDAVARIEQQIAKLAPAYLENRKKELVELRRFADTTDFKSIQSIGHRLKGNAHSYGFDGLAEVGAGLEIAARDQDLDKVRALIEKVAEYLSST